jgi:hypothetical protein
VKVAEAELGILFNQIVIRRLTKREEERALLSGET